MKRNDLKIGAGILVVAAGGFAALADVAPVPVRKPLLPGIDVSISCIGVSTGGSLSTGTFGIFNAGSNGLPAGVFGLACGTTSCNQQPDNGPPTTRFPSGSGIVAGSQYWMGDWYAPFESGTNWDGTNLNTDAGNRHPYIAQAIYRINAEGRLEQLGTSWFKHSWSAASGAMAGQTGTATGNDPCGIGSSCFNLNTDNQLEANCADTYSAGHNSDTYYMGPRSEVNPRKGWNDPGWTRFGAYVDNYTSSDVLATTGQNDGVRSLTGGTLQSWKMARAAYADISTAALGPNGRMIMEGYYVVNGDGYKLNNIGHRQLTSTVAPGATSASISNFALSGRHVWGPALLQWGEQKSVATPQTDGDVYVTSRAVNLGGGQWRYEYNVFNLDLNQNVNAFEVPVPSFANVTNMNFRQPRQFVLGQDGADWVGSYDGAKKSVVWMAQAAPAKTNAELAAMVPPLPANTVLKPNNITWGTMYTFWFTCNLDPRSDASVKLTPGAALTAGTQLTGEARAPRHPADLGKQGGEAGADGMLDNNDFIKFIDFFFAMDSKADLGVQGGGQGTDGLYDNNDFIAFIDYFFMS